MIQTDKKTNKKKQVENYGKIPPVFPLYNEQ